MQGDPCSSASSPRTRIVTSRSSPGYGSARSGRSRARKKSSQCVSTTRARRRPRPSRPSRCGCSPRSGRRAGRAEVGDVGPASGERPGTKPALPWTSAVAPAGVLDQHRPGLAALVGAALTGGTTGAVISPGKRSGGQWCDSTRVSVKARTSSCSPCRPPGSGPRAGRHRARRSRSTHRRPASAPVRSATTAESIAWSKCECTGTTAASRSRRPCASAASMRAGRARSCRARPRARRPREEAVGHDLGLAVVEQQRARRRGR